MKKPAAPPWRPRRPKVSAKPALITAFLLFHSAVFAAERWTIGLATSGVPVEALSVAGPSPSAPTVLLIGGLHGNDVSVDVVKTETALFDKIPQGRRPFRLLAIPLANPEAQALQFPPAGIAYRENIESHVLWRWIGTHAPDLVLIASASDAGLAAALSQQAVAEVGRIAARRVEPSVGILQSIPQPITASEARLELDRRRARTPREFADELARVYGREFNQPNYIAAMAIVSRFRLAHTADVTQLLMPYLEGTRDSFARPSQSSLAAHMLFAEFAARTDDERALRLVRRAADSGFTETGELRDFMPLHGGWSDSLFMDVPILAKAGALTGERRYFDMAARHFAFMEGLVRRSDGLYRHQASAEAAWGRGNAFAALGVALTLSDFPKDHPQYSQLLTSFQRHIAMLARFQDENGMWRNVIDHAGAYPEYSATAMIGAAMQRGVRNGWLEAATYQALVDRAWDSIKTRTGTDGRVVDVCESTGTRGLTNADYLRRAAILGRDERGGGMAMFFATELAGLDGR